MSNAYDSIEDPTKWVLDYAMARTGRKLDYRDLEEIGIKFEPGNAETEKAAGNNVKTLRNMVNQSYEALLDA